MQSKASTVKEYLKEIPPERLEAFKKLRLSILENLPVGFCEVMAYGGVGYVVPHSLYPNGYHCDPKLPLTFAGIASQKNFIGFYHMGIYANHDLMNWFVKEYKAQNKNKLDMGKSCIRFKKPDQIPFQLIGELMQKISVKEWITLYEKNLPQSKKK